MKNRNQIKRWRSAALFGMLMTVLLFPTRSVRAAQTDLDAVVSAAAQILYHNEGSYHSVNPNDNGAVSIGKLQWHGWRALSLLQTIVNADKDQAQQMLGDALYQEVTSAKDTSKWSTRKLTTKETTAVQKLLATDESKAAQDALAVKDITEYIQQGQRLGITNQPALVYFADLTNQGGSGASGRVAASASRYTGSYETVTLNELHEAAICDTVMGYSAYLSRRFETYSYAAGLGWTYCNASDSYIPSDYVTARDSGTAWVQRALNTCMNAGLAVTDTYDSGTAAAVTRFQAANKLEADGYAGKDTIVALIKLIFKGTSIQDPGTSPQNPGTSTEEPGVPSQNPGTSIEEPGASVQEPQNPEPPVQEPVVKPLEKTVLKSQKASYAVNETQKGFQLQVTSTHAAEPLTYRSTESAVLTVDSTGQVTITGAGKAEVVVRQRETDTYAAGELSIPVTVYSVNPWDYTRPTGALYAGKNMKTQHVQWLQAALIALDGADITVNGSWTSAMTKLVTAFQKKCAIEADGIVGDQTRDLLLRMLYVAQKKPEATIKCTAKGNTLSWKKYVRANRVYIYRKEKGGAYKRIKTITNMKKTSWQDTTAKSGTTYDYVIKYGLQQNQVLVKSPSSKGVTGIRR